MAALCALLGWRIFNTSPYILLMNAGYFILETELCEMARSLLYRFYKGTPRNFTQVSKLKLCIACCIPSYTDDHILQLTLRFFLFSFLF